MYINQALSKGFGFGFVESNERPLRATSHSHAFSEHLCSLLFVRKGSQSLLHALELGEGTAVLGRRLRREPSTPGRQGSQVLTGS